MKKVLLGTVLTLVVVSCVRADEPTTMPAPSVQSPNYYHQTWNKRFGIGAIFGEPTGVSAKYWLNDTMAIDGAMGWGFFQETHFYTHADVLWHCFDLFPVSEGRMPLYYGVGPRLKLRDDDRERFGARFPIGVSYIFDRAPIDVFAEVAPILDFTPNVRAAFSAGVGIRYWF